MSTSTVYTQALDVVQQRLGDTRQIDREYRNVVKWDQLIDHTVEASQRPENGPRNRYSNVLPYDHNRVELNSQAPHSYVNASHVVFNETGAASLRCHYIATQGPLSGTVEDFWTLILETGSKAVVMLTNFVENRLNKCVSYFPSEQGKQIAMGRLRVRCTGMTTDTTGSLTVRTIEIHSQGRDGKPATSTVHHFHFHAWPDHGTPEHSIAIRMLCDALPADRRAPIVVHCSAGIGRTGTFIAVDIVRLRLRKLQEAADKGATVGASEVQAALAIPELVHQLRQQRMGMVQTPEQYHFIYLALLEDVEEMIRSRAHA